MGFRQSIERFFGEDALDWLDYAYLLDWLAVGAIWIAGWVVSEGPVFERDFSLKDKLISHPHKKNTVDSAVNHNIALFVPIAVILVASGLRRSLVEIHHGIIAVCAARGLARLITEALKHAVGRLRPDFLARCHWNEAAQMCKGKAEDILKGRLSFPSGHSSTAFSGMTVLSLYLAGRTAAWCFNVPLPSRSLRSSRMANFAITLIPLYWAGYVAVTRLQDYRHHKEDVIVGSLLGILCALICYLAFWPSPFFAKNFSYRRTGQPRILYSESHHTNRRDVEFELTGLDEEEQGNMQRV